MNEILDDLVARSGVEAAFVCDAEGGLLASGYKNPRYQDVLPTLSNIFARANTTLQSLKHGVINEIEWVYGNGRLLVRGLDSALLCLICTRSINLQLLTMQLEDVVDQIRPTLESKTPTHSPQEMEALRSEMISIAEDMLGQHAGKVVAILKNADATLDSMKDACEQSEKVTRLFIDRKNAGEMGDRMRGRLDAN